MPAGRRHCRRAVRRHRRGAECACRRRAGGDDALAMTLHEVLHQPIERIYLASDLIVLALSATYLPLNRLACSLLTVILSGQLLGLIQRIPSPLAQKGEELSD